MNILIEIVSPFFVLIFLGFAFGKIFKGNDSGLYWLNNFIIYLAVPALLFSLLSKAPIKQIVNVEFVFITTSITVLIFIISFIYLLYLRRLPMGNSCLYATSSSFGNVGYMGIPLMVALLGEEAIIPATLILIFDNIIHLIIVPIFAGNNEQGSKLKRVLYGLKEVIKNPFLIATLLGIFVSAYNFPTPDLIVNITNQLSSAAIPTALFSLGLSLSLSQFSGITFNKAFLITMKLIIHPILVAAIIIPLGIFPPVWEATAIIMASLPTALTVYMLARQYNNDAKTISSITLFGTIISVGTISIIIYIIDLKVFSIGS